MWVIMAFSFFALLVAIPSPESYRPVIERREAIKARKRGINCIIPPAPSKKQLVIISLTRPAQLMLHEPIIVLVAIYISFVFGTLYLFFLAYPFVFHGIHGFSISISGLMFLAIGVGFLTGGVSQVYFFKRDLRLIKANNGRLPEESQLIKAVFGAPLIPISVFWFAWTSKPNISWASPCIAGFVFGLGSIWIFMGCINFVTLSYPKYAASAMAVNSCMRFTFSCVFPIFANPMFKALGIGWSLSILGFIFIILMPIPLVFTKYGSQIRGASERAGRNPTK